MWRSLSLLVTFASLADSTGTCGSECKSDADCGKCGSSSTGRCSSPAAHTAYPAIAATCVDAPSDAPKEPKANVADSRWPDTWTADVQAYVYKDWSSNAVESKGNFYYDITTGHTRTDWHPYVDGRDAKQVWISGSETEKSAYYVKSGPICIYFTIHDPGMGGSVGVELPDWIQRCDTAGMATYEGRERVDGEWVDHYSCLIDYAKVNQTIVFQNWHSLGLGKTPKGLPVRVTGGNSAPNAQKGSPRLSSVWYSNFTTGANAVKPEDFAKPNWGWCIPVGSEEAETFLGLEKLTAAHLSHPDAQRRAHYLPHANPAKSDLARARQKLPRAKAAGSSLQEAAVKLNRFLTQERGLTTRACSSFKLEELHGVHRELFSARSPILQSIYVGDRRSLRYASEAELAEAHKLYVTWSEDQPHLLEIVRDGLCHELVMMYMHHLSASARAAVKEGAFVLPLLPEGGLHQKPVAAQHGDGIAAAIHQSYTNKTSCAICHVARPVAKPHEIVV